MLFLDVSPGPLIRHPGPNMLLIGGLALGVALVVAILIVRRERGGGGQG